ncbi:MAG: hypothetical protein JAY90_10600 [Candidatus Thiodiazotropha lotti]|nr:hypothetical protein [Candidatus Thiodiazotropha lotti]
MPQAAITAGSPHSPPYQRHYPERTLLYQIIERHYPVEVWNTLAGLIVYRLRYIPIEVDAITEEGHRLTVMEAAARSVIKVRVELL